MFEGKVALVTGSSQGIGQVIATKFAEYGADVVVHGLGLQDLPGHPRHGPQDCRL